MRRKLVGVERQAEEAEEAEEEDGHLADSKQNVKV